VVQQNVSIKKKTGGIISVNFKKKVGVRTEKKGYKTEQWGTESHIIRKKQCSEYGQKA